MEALLPVTGLSAALVEMGVCSVWRKETQEGELRLLTVFHCELVRTPGEPENELMMIVMMLMMTVAPSAYWPREDARRAEGVPWEVAILIYFLCFVPQSAKNIFAHSAVILA